MGYAVEIVLMIINGVSPFWDLGLVGQVPDLVDASNSVWQNVGALRPACNSLQRRVHLVLSR